MSDLPSVDLTTIDFFPTGPLAEDEEYLWSILSDRSGIDIAEFTFVDEEKIDRCFRTRAYQQAWLRDNSRFQIEQNARDVGKALCLTTPIFTANRGWVTMGTIEVGDVVFDETGAQCNVTKVFAELIGRDCYEVRFDDNSTLVCDGESPCADGAGDCAVVDVRAERAIAQAGPVQEVEPPDRGGVSAGLRA